MIEKTSRWALITIAVVLLANLFLDRIFPRLALEMSQKDYEVLVVACEKARASASKARFKLAEDQALKDELLKSLNVELIKCVDEEIKRNELLDAGVTQPAIRAIALKAMVEDRAVPLER